VIALATASTSTSAWDQPGTLGFLVVFGMGVVLYFVFRSMAKHLRKVRQAAWLESERAEKADAASQTDGGQPDEFADKGSLGQTAGDGSPGRR
jgi:hypothetical protein